ncbi:hypothetical protein DPX39_000015500 [Trypanosoma brucei equiperdum]|uniref:Uncharacterized protein n=1 Tax=Trypanosoma brucei equiperdum TaxID=630700 RepID=A0A3L6KSF2_9TRYP|nr:hypothetical protein DPX39_000015500 [Trypanosoma brucei equiperdum]
MCTSTITQGASTTGIKQALQQITDAVREWEQTSQRNAKSAEEIVFNVATSSEFASRAYLLATGKPPNPEETSAVTVNTVQIKKDVQNTAQAFKDTFLEGLFKEDLSIPSTLKITNNKLKEISEPELQKLTDYLRQELLFSTKVEARKKCLKTNTEYLDAKKRVPEPSC